MAWILYQLRRLQFERAACRAAKARFREVYPQHAVNRVHVVGREEDAVVVAVEHRSDWIPAPETFFRVHRSRPVIEECEAPADYGPWL